MQFFKIGVVAVLAVALIASLADANGYPQVGENPAQFTRAGLHAFKQSIGILGTCMKEAPEFASRKRHQEPQPPA